MPCTVVLRLSHSTYSPGSKILGHLICTFTSAENIRGVKVKLIGKEHTEWIERESFYDYHVKKMRHRDIVYNGDNEFLAKELSLLGEKTMEPGRYEYPFNFTLPRNLPENFNGNHGYIKYFIKGTVGMPFVSDYEDEAYFNMSAPIDFNYIRNALQMEPCTYQDEKTVGCFYCVTGPITLDVHLQKEAFILGEVAKVKIDVTNSSNENIHEMTLKLKTVIESTATCPKTSHKHDTELWASNSVSGVGAHGQRTYDLNFSIPNSAAIYNFSGCTLFKQWSVLRIEAVIPGCSENMEVEAGVMIGHIALCDDTQSQPTHEISNTSSAISSSERPYPPPQPVSPPPPYPATGTGAPYPTGPPTFPVPSSGTPGKIGFNLPASLRSRHSPAHSSSAAAANAPPAEFTPSAPTQSEMTNGGEFDPTSGSPELPPPSYSDAVDASFAISPRAGGVYPPASHKGPAVPPPK